MITSDRSQTSKRASSVSYRSDTVQEDHPSELLDDENTQLSLDPKLQVYLAQVSEQNGCWGRFFPIPFERAAQKSWWDPTFDSEILEEQYRRSSNPYCRYKFRYALWYMLLISSSWLIYFLVTGLILKTNHWPILCAALGVLILLMTAVLFLTYTDLYNNHMLLISLTVAFVLCLISLSFVILLPIKTDPLTVPKNTSDMSPVGHFSICIEMLMVIYTLIPLKLYMSITIGILYSLAFEILTITTQDSKIVDFNTIIVRFLAHICIHLIGLHILIMTNVRMRNTFMKVGQSLLVRRQLESEKRLKENMIHSLMPPSVANWLLSEDETFATRNEQRNSDPDTSHNDISSIFRPFNMNRMENVSILFADIVGFTKMSSNKSAEELVEILNDLFQRFDHLCKYHNCEKISTLGDCYYCVSGCPEPRVDHARCCVEMGLSMIQAIKQFDQERNEGVNMRVGVHTGTVLCGIVGTKRFKFDVWSNDVTLANRMESTGKPGMVHISEKTCEFLHEQYQFEDGESVFGLKTFFILGRAGDRTPSYSGSFRAEGRQKYTNSLQLFVSPPTSSPTMSPQTRPRVLSCDTTSSFLKATTHNPNMLSPDVCRMKASSLPSILDSDNEQDAENNAECLGGEGDNIKTPTSTASSGKYTVKLKNWKIPRFLRKNDQNKNELDTDQQVPSISEDLILPMGYQQVPTIIESNGNGNPNILNGKKKESFASVTDANEEKRNSILTETPKDTIDVKSYISQSRSDMGQYDYSANDLSQFMRTGSYRSQYGRSPNEFSFLQRAGSNRSRRGRSPNFDVFPGERARSVTVGNLDRPKKSLEVPRLTNISVLEDHFTSQTVNSRKDSGIKSNSRRSSVQQLDNPLPNNSDVLQHRVSGYYTSSQSTVNSPHYVMRIPGPFFDKSGTCIQNLRKQSDRQLIKCVQENSKSRGSYFIKPPLSMFTLFFKDKQMELDYRANVHSLSEHTEPILTLANSKFNTYFDVCVSSLVFIIVSICLILLYGFTSLWLIVFLCFLTVHSLAWALCFEKFVDITENCFEYCVSRFYRWNMFGAVLVSLPLVSVLVNFCTKITETSNYLYTYLLFIGVIHFCNFTQLNCWMKNVLVTLYVIIFIPLFLNGNCSSFFLDIANKTDSTDNENNLSHYIFLYKSEILMDLFLLIFLVWLLNREFEIGYRLSFHANYVSNRDKINVQELKNQADYLIYNIVPEHVAEQLKKNAKYSENFKDVAIIFASIVNFNEMYDESYMGGKEFLRVLNELIGDFDELLDRPQFRSVEKIKTIGSTFMAASGLNSQLRLQQEDPHEHLYALMDFALEMQKVVGNFNKNLLEFELILRIGYNFGEVTAAVIGNTKLFYDIWGDAVNIASRMDSTGVNGRIQAGENCLRVLEKKFVFEPRGSVYVKGKDHMNVYLLLDKKINEQDEIDDDEE